jgi:hypothetical protein
MKLFEPLSSQVPIVGPDGKPTAQFQRVMQKISVGTGLVSSNGTLSLSIPDGAVTTAKLAASAVTNAKLADMATKTIKARKTGTTGSPEDCTLSDILDFVGSAAQGDILYRGASGWTRLGAGTSGQVLTTQGTGANPIWSTVSGGGGGSTTLAGLTDVAIATPLNAQVLTYDTASGKWKNVTPTSAVVNFVMPNGYTTSNDTGAFATLSTALVTYKNVTVTELYGQFNNATIGNVYNMFIAVVNSAGTIQSVLTTGTAFTTTATGFQQHTFPIASPVTLTAGTLYIVGIVITNGTTTSSCRAVFLNPSNGFQTIPIDSGVMLQTWATNSKRFWYTSNSASPTVGLTATGNSVSGAYGTGFGATW